MKARLARHHGVTLLELLVALAVAGVLAALAIPAFTTLIQDNRRTVVLNELVSSLLLARSEAAKRGQAVSVCGSTAAGFPDCGGGENWDAGWQVFVDPDADGNLAAATDRLRVFRVDYPVTIRITTVGPGHLSLRPFNQDGTSALVTVCDKRGAAQARGVILTGNGRARTVEKKADGSALSCPP